jgi:hypothetical protein
MQQSLGVPELRIVSTQLSRIGRRPAPLASGDERRLGQRARPQLSNGGGRATKLHRTQ